MTWTSMAYDRIVKYTAITEYIVALLFHTFVCSAGWRYNCVQFWISDKIGKILQTNKNKNFTSNHTFYYNFMETSFVFWLFWFLPNILYPPKVRFPMLADKVD